MPQLACASMDVIFHAFGFLMLMRCSSVMLIADLLGLYSAINTGHGCVCAGED